MLNHSLKSVALTGLIGLMIPTIAQAKPYPRLQAQPYQVFQTPNPGIHRNIISNPQQIYSTPQRQPNHYDYYPGYDNSYYTKPIRPNQSIIVIERDRPNNTPYYYRDNIYYQNGTPYYFRGNPYYQDHTPYYSRKVPYYDGHNPNNWQNSIPSGSDSPRYPYYQFR